MASTMHVAQASLHEQAGRTELTAVSLYFPSVVPEQRAVMTTPQSHFEVP